MRISIEDFEVKNFVGDWVLDSGIILDKETILEELLIISRNPEEFDFHLYDAMSEANLRGVDETLIENTLFRYFVVEKVYKQFGDFKKKT